MLEKNNLNTSTKSVYDWYIGTTKFTRQH